MGWERTPEQTARVCVDEDFTSWQTHDGRIVITGNRDQKYTFLWSPDTNIKDAWEIIEHLKVREGRKLLVTINSMFGGFRVVSFAPEECLLNAVAIANEKTAELAICKIALEADTPLVIGKPKVCE